MSREKHIKHLVVNNFSSKLYMSLVLFIQDECDYSIGL